MRAANHFSRNGMTAKEKRELSEWENQIISGFVLHEFHSIRHEEDNVVQRRRVLPVRHVYGDIPILCVVRRLPRGVHGNVFIVENPDIELLDNPCVGNLAGKRLMDEVFAGKCNSYWEVFITQWKDSPIASIDPGATTYKSAKPKPKKFHVPEQGLPPIDFIEGIGIQPEEIGLSNYVTACPV